MANTCGWVWVNSLALVRTEGALSPVKGTGCLTNDIRLGCTQQQLLKKEDGAQLPILACCSVCINNAAHKSKS